MLHHVSFTARDPRHVARVVAEMMDGETVRAPAPPFPQGSWFVCYGDSEGSFIEILPWGTALDPDAKFGFAHDSDARQHTGAHVLMSTPRSTERLRALAERARWRFELVDARPFKVIKIWAENTQLIEFLTPEHRAIYLETFGAAGLTALNDKLRALESGMTQEVGHERRV